MTETFCGKLLRRGWVLLLFLAFSALNAPVASADWGQKLTMAEMEGVYAQGIVFNWQVSMGFGDAGGRFRFNFRANGNIRPDNDDDFEGARIGLLGGLVNVTAGHRTGSEGSGPPSSTPTHVVVNLDGGGGTGSASFSGSTTTTGGSTSTNSTPPTVQTHDNNTEVKVSDGVMNISFGGGDSNKNSTPARSLVSIVGANFSSDVNLELQLIERLNAPSGRLNIIRSSVCGGCPPS